LIQTARKYTGKKRERQYKVEQREQENIQREAESKTIY